MDNKRKIQKSNSSSSNNNKDNDDSNNSNNRALPPTPSLHDKSQNADAGAENLARKTHK